ncbi:MAG: cytochrome c biogenesis protein CcsA [Actinomycetota bacterium]|nr:cytochrome c biogenesis protein CcsA [Actinomycetota bacterium]
MAELLLWSSLLAYGEATAAFGVASRHPVHAGRLGTWGIRLGWLAQTALLAVQAVRADGFPWSSWAGSLNLFVWLVVSVYLIWGCRARYRLLGLGVAPLAFGLLVVARLGGGTGSGSESHYSDLFLVLHVGLVLAAFAGFTLAAALAGLYLWQERRLKSRSASVLRVSVPSLATLDELEGRTIAVALPALTLGIAVGFLRVRSTGAGFDVLMVVTVVTWLVYGAFIVLRYGAGWRGRRAAYLALAGFALVLAVRLGLPVTHFS